MASNLIGTKPLSRCGTLRESGNNAGFHRQLPDSAVLRPAGRDEYRLPRWQSDGADGHLRVRVLLARRHLFGCAERWLRKHGLLGDRVLEDALLGLMIEHDDADSAVDRVVGVGLVLHQRGTHPDNPDDFLLL